MSQPTINRGALLRAIGDELLRLFQRSGSLNDLDLAVEMHTRTIEFTATDDPNRANILHHLAVALHSRFERTGSMKDLDSVIERCENALESSTLHRVVRATILNSLGLGLQRRFENSRLMEDLENAIRKKEEALKLAPPRGHPLYTTRLNNLSIGLRSRFKNFGIIEDLNRAIEAREDVYRTRFKTLGSMEDINHAIHLGKVAVDSIPLRHPNRSGYILNLCNSLCCRYEQTSYMDDLNQGIDFAADALRCTPTDHTIQVAILNKSGVMLRYLFETAGSTEHLDSAIELTEKAAELTPIGSRECVPMLNNLAIALLRRFERTGSMQDLERAIEAQQRAIDTTQNGSLDHEGLMANLGIMLQRKFERTEAMKDIDLAIQIGEKAIQCTPVGHSSRLIALSNLGIALHRRSLRGSIDNMNCVINIVEQVLELTPADASNHRLNALRLCLLSRFEGHGAMEDANRAVYVLEQTVEHTPRDSPAHALYCNNLGKALYRHFERTASAEDGERVINIMAQVAASEAAYPSIRLDAAQISSHLLIKQGNYSRAKEILLSAIQLLQRVSPRHLQHSDALFNISHFNNITSRLVSISLELGDDPFTALQLLEFGRGMLASWQLETRSDVLVLQGSHPVLAEKLRELRDKIDPPSQTLESSLVEVPSLPSTFPARDTFNSTFRPTSISGYRVLQRQFDELLQHIRSLEGFHHFLQELSESELRNLANDDTIVVLNVSDIRTDAFLITADAIRCLHLHLLSGPFVFDLTKNFLEAVTQSDLMQARIAIQKIDGVLKSLWDHAVNPILQTLGFTQTPISEETWPRVWWVGSGLLSVLRFHAAGYHDANPPQSTFDRIVSSSISTAKSLAYAKEKASRLSSPILNESAVIFTMPSTPDEMDLPFVEREIEVVKQALSKRAIKTTVLRNPTKAEVIAHLPNHSIAHFPCHGFSAIDPSKSGLLFDDWTTAPLTVSDIMSLNLKCTTLAYLSACCTSAMYDSHLFDESISLSSAIQLSGYPSVIGTLWQVQDQHSVDVANTIYSTVVGGDSGLNARETARGLHKAVRQLRDSTRIAGRWHDPLVWAPFIHVGY